MEKEKNSGILIQGSILAAAGLITKIIGLIYKIPLNNMMGKNAYGTFMNAFIVYSIALTFSYNSMPMAISKLISASNAKGNQRSTQKIFFHSAILCTLLGLIASLLLFFGAGFFEIIMQTDGMAPAIRMLAPTVFTVSLLGLFRGYFQGYNNMVPTSVSQIIEQVINAVTALICVAVVEKSVDEPSLFSSKAARGACTGTFAGAAAALVVLIFMFFKFYKGNRENIARSKNINEDSSQIYRSIILTIIPMIISQTIYQIGGFFDSIIFKFNLVTVKKYIEDDVTGLQGIFTGQYNQLVNLPVSVATALAVTLLPAIAFESSKKNIKGRDEKILSILKLTSLIAFPGAIGICVMAKPVIQLLYSKLSPEDMKLASGLLICGFSAVITYSFSTITTSILQGSGHMRKPVYNSAVSLGIHIVLVFVLTLLTPLDTYALVIADVLFPFVIMILNIRSMKKDMGYSTDIKAVCLKPLICSVIMGIVTFAVYSLIYKVTERVLISFIPALLAAMASYFGIIFKIGFFTRDEMFELPMGRTLIRIFRIKE